MTIQETFRPRSSAQSREWKAIVPTLMVGDYVFVAKYAYGYGRYSFPFAPSWISGRVFAAEPEYGDIVVFRTAKDSSVDYVKRVVGLPGDRIRVRQGQLILNDPPVTRVALEHGLAGIACGVDGSFKVKRWRETLPSGVSYVTYDCIDNGFLDVTDVFTVPPGHFFVLGDNATIPPTAA